jgi:hypothetical protein
MLAPSSLPISVGSKEGKKRGSGEEVERKWRGGGEIIEKSGRRHSFV